jgi:hypothetical protein
MRKQLLATLAMALTIAGCSTQRQWEVYEKGGRLPDLPQAMYVSDGNVLGRTNDLALAVLAKLEESGWKPSPKQQALLNVWQRNCGIAKAADRNLDKYSLASSLWENGDKWSKKGWEFYENKINAYRKGDVLYSRYAPAPFGEYNPSIKSMPFALRYNSVFNCFVPGTRDISFDVNFTYLNPQAPGSAPVPTLSKAFNMNVDEGRRLEQDNRQGKIQYDVFYRMKQVVPDNSEELSFTVVVEPIGLVFSTRGFGGRLFINLHGKVSDYAMD